MAGEFGGGRAALRLVVAEAVRRPVLPVVADADRAFSRTPIDAFILKALREKNLAPSPEADRRTLIRRLYFDLIGLPPTPQEVAAFEAGHISERLRKNR